MVVVEVGMLGVVAGVVPVGEVEVVLVREVGEVTVVEAVVLVGGVGMPGAVVVEIVAMGVVVVPSASCT